jgi:hypothetical protein
MVERSSHNRSVVSSNPTVAKMESFEKEKRRSREKKRKELEERKEGKRECKHDGINNRWDHEEETVYNCHQWDQ